MIFTDRAAKEKISSLESRIAELEADLVTKDSAIESLNADIVAKDQTIAENSATIGTLQEAVAKFETEAKASAEAIATLTAEVDKAKNSATDQAAAMLAQVGQPEPLEITPEAQDKPNEISRDEFNKLTPSAKMNFVKNGGKLI